jgi:hypothetical protein
MDQNEACVTDPRLLAAGLSSSDAAERLKTLRCICPCRMGWEAFDACRPMVQALQKDADPEIRRVAQHVMADAFQMKNEGQPTSRAQVRNDMAARKQRLRGLRHAD